MGKLLEKSFVAAMMTTVAAISVTYGVAADDIPGVKMAPLGEHLGLTPEQNKVVIDLLIQRDRRIDELWAENVRLKELCGEKCREPGKGSQTSLQPAH